MGMTVTFRDTHNLQLAELVGHFPSSKAFDQLTKLQQRHDEMEEEIRIMRGLEDSYDSEEDVLAEIFLRLNKLCG